MTVQINYELFTSKPQTFHFDSHEFAGNYWGRMAIEAAPFFDIAYRARRGDEAAIAVAQACGLYLTDISGQAYVDYRKKQ